MEPTERGERVRQLFLEAARMPEASRDQWLRQQGEGDDQLLSEVRSLLRYDDIPVDPLESGPVFSTDAASPEWKPAPERSVVPGYRIVREIGTGGQAIVYQAIQESTTQRVALKMLRWGRLASAQERERLRREVVILAQLSHPGIVSIIDCGETREGVFFVVTQYVDGHRLDELLELSASEAALFGAKSQDEYCSRVLRVFLKLCDAVDAAHRHGVVHRDLKPANILIDKLGEPRVLDFGLAKPGFHEQLDATEKITTSGQFMGSLPWASPEQAAGEQVDARSDIYSLGVILYQLLSGGEFPYDVSGSMGEVITKIMHADPTPLERAIRDRPQISAQAWPQVESVDGNLNALVMKALRKPREDRYQAARELKQAIEEYLGVGGDAADKVAGRQSGIGVLVAAAGGIAMVAALVIFIAPFFGSIRDRGDRTAETTALAEQSVGLAWTSLDKEFNDLVDDDSVTKTRDGWRIRDREIAFAELESEVLVLRATLQRYTNEPMALRLRARDGTEVNANIVRKSGTDVDVVSLAMSARSFIAGQFDCPWGAQPETQLTFSVLEDRITLAHNGQLFAQLHCQTDHGPWTPIVDAKSTVVDCVALEYALPDSAPPGSMADVATQERPAVEFIVRHDGAALSQRSTGAVEEVFHVTGLTTDDSSELVRAKEVAKIARCGRITRLKLQHLTEADEALEHLAKLKFVMHLDIAYAKLPDDCFQHFAEMEGLVSLGLFRTQIESVDLGPLQRLRSLQALWLTSTMAGDADLEALAGITSLRKFAVRGDAVTAKGIGSLLQLPELEWIDLPGAKISGDGIRQLSGLPNLWRLDLSDSDVADDDVPHLAKMSKLGRLTVDGTQLTVDGVDSLRTKLPNCEIRFDQD